MIKMMISGVPFGVKTSDPRHRQRRLNGAHDIDECMLLVKEGNTAERHFTVQFRTCSMLFFHIDTCTLSIGR